MVYIPIFRARQQELKVLRESEFGRGITPLIEVIKEKDRKNNPQTSLEIYTQVVNDVQADRVLLDLPAYLKIGGSTNDEVVAFSRTVLESLDERINFLNQFARNNKVIPVISSLIQLTGEANSIQIQFDALRDNFENIAFRTFHKTFDDDLQEIQMALRPQSDILIYDLDTVSITSSVLRIHRRNIQNINADNKILFRSAINADIQNVQLDHGDIVADADNSLVELFGNYDFNGFGDYVGIKKDDISSGGTISPGFIFYDPVENMYYGYKGSVKRLEEFETTIVPDLLHSNVIENLMTNFAEYLNNNPGFEVIQNISAGHESGKSQAKFKKISMQHYLHCIRAFLAQDTWPPLP